MHEADIVHGNLKPSNALVFQTRDGKMALVSAVVGIVRAGQLNGAVFQKLSDYGLSKETSSLATLGYLAP
jgi:serine/threonine protein kinase